MWLTQSKTLNPPEALVWIMRRTALSSLGSQHGEKCIMHFISCIDIWNASYGAGTGSNCAQSHCEGRVMLVKLDACYDQNMLSYCLCLCCWDLLPWKPSPFCPFRLLLPQEPALFSIILNSCFEICSPEICLKCSGQQGIIVRTWMDRLTQGCTKQVEGIVSCIPCKRCCIIFLKSKRHFWILNTMQNKGV